MPEEIQTLFMFAGAITALLAAAKFFGRAAPGGCRISGDMETLWLGGKRYEFICCTYSDEQRGRLLEAGRPLRAGGRLGKIEGEKLYVRALRGMDADRYLAVTGSGSVDIFRRIDE